MTAAVRVAAMKGSVLYIDANGSACPRRLKLLAAEIAGQVNPPDALELLSQRCQTGSKQRHESLFLSPLPPSPPPPPFMV